MTINKTLISLAVSMAVAGSAVAATKNSATTNSSTIKHVLLISVDGLHQNDLDWFVQQNHNSTLATIVNNGIKYTNASTPFPSDSFPGLVAQATGGNPQSTGIYYDDSYSRALLPLGTSVTDCQAKTVAAGAEVQYAENIDKTTNGLLLLDAGQGISGLYPVPAFTPGVLDQVPTTILSLKSSPADIRSTLIDPTQLPVDPSTCNVVYPHQYLQVNTIFEVAKAHGLNTAWTDKHPAYEILNGPSGTGVDDLFAPEINSQIADNASAADWTKNNINTQRYDSIKVVSIINEINGYDHAGIKNPGTPAIFGMNFQAVSTAQKLNTSTTPESPTVAELGGYTNNGTVPGQVVQSALSFVDSSLKQIFDEINNNPSTQANTAIIISAKHGQSPQSRSDLTIIDDGALTTALNNAWAQKNPKAKLPLVAHAMDDDGVLLWLNDRSTAALSFTKQFLLNYTTGKTLSGVKVPAGVGSDSAGVKISKPFSNAGLRAVYAGVDAQKLINVKATDQRVPDVIGIAKQGSVYAGGSLSKVAEHGGYSINDRHVPILVWGPGIKHGVSVNSNVETTQIAPTILKLLGLDPSQLQAVQAEKTQVLPQIN